ncbi:MAG: hypothetical protein KA791_07250 [Flavobacteriales bacterium]|nr:hypothetical protein [Flavobacteriales bacterium]
MDASPTAIAQSQLFLQVVTLALVIWILVRQKSLIKTFGAHKPDEPDGN